MKNNNFLKFFSAKAKNKEENYNERSAYQAKELYLDEKVLMKLGEIERREYLLDALEQFYAERRREKSEKLG